MKALEVGEVNDPGKGITEKDIFTPGSAEDITVALEDTLLNSPTIAGSRFVHRIWEEEWQENVLLFQEKLDVILAVQRNGTYLESIFSAGDVRKQLHTESANFMDIDAEGRKTMCESPKYQAAVVIEKVQKSKWAREVQMASRPA